MFVALNDLGLEHLRIIYHEDQIYPVQDKITVWPFREIFGLRTQISKQGSHRLLVWSVPNLTKPLYF